MRVDEAGHEHFAREAAVDAMGEITNPRLELFERADVDDQSIPDCDGGRLGLARLHCDDLLCDEDDDLASRHRVDGDLAGDSGQIDD